MRLLGIIALATLLLLAGCTTPIRKSVSVAHRTPMSTGQLETARPSTPSQSQAPLSPPSQPIPFEPTLPIRSAIVQSAAQLVGARAITSQGRRIAYDCAGVTRAVYLEHGIDLYQTPSDNEKANGVRLIYNHIRRHGRLYRGSTVRPGDLVFFDNTWDFNGDGAVNDPLTHIGIVEDVEPDGTVTFISRVATAIERYRMNLEQPRMHKSPDGRVLNDYIRRRHPTDPADIARLTGELFAFYGNLLSPQNSLSRDGTGVPVEDTSTRSTSTTLEQRCCTIDR